MRSAFALVLVPLLLGVARPSAVAPGTIVVTVAQLPGGAAVLSGAGGAVAELGTVSGNARAGALGIEIVRRSKSYVVVTAIGLKASGGLSGTVSLQAFLDEPIPGVAVRIDGVELGSVPRTFAPHSPQGVVTRHRLEVEIPTSMDPARVPQDIPLEFGAVSD